MPILKMALEYDEIIAIIIGQIVGTITFTMFYDKLLKVTTVRYEKVVPTHLEV